MGAGRPEWFPDEEFIQAVEKHARLGLTDEQIGRCLGYAPSTMSEKKKKFPEIFEAIKRGQAFGVKTVSNALFQNATESNNTTAQIFCLKNRSPQEWHDRKETKISGNLTIEQILDELDGKPDSSP